MELYVSEQIFSFHFSKTIVCWTAVTDGRVTQYLTKTRLTTNGLWTHTKNDQAASLTFSFHWITKKVRPSPCQKTPSNSGTGMQGATSFIYRSRCSTVSHVTLIFAEGSYNVVCCDILKQISIIRNRTTICMYCSYYNQIL